MRWNFLFGGKAGDGANAVAQIMAEIFSELGYFVFNYRDYQSLIRGGHNFNILSVSDKPVYSSEFFVNGIVATDKRTVEIHKKENKGFVIDNEKFRDEGKNLNIALAGAFAKKVGIEKNIFLSKIKKFGNSAVKSGVKGHESEVKEFEFKNLGRRINLLDGSEGVTIGALKSDLDLYIAYPMTPATGVLHDLGMEQLKNKKLKVFQAENEIGAVNSSLGASFAGSNVMTGTSGGGFDLMTEGISLQGISEIPLTIYLSQRPGPGTGVPTYTAQADLDIALRAGHGDFPRVVIAPGDANECVEKTNEAIYLSQKFNSLSILLSDKHLAGSVFSSTSVPKKFLKIKRNRKIPSEGFVKASSYEVNEFGNSTENPEIVKKRIEKRLQKYSLIKKECKKFEMTKVYGNKNSKNLIIGWGSTKGAILDAISEIKDVKFVQVLYVMPMSDGIKSEMQNAKKILLIENSATGQLGKYLKEKTGITIPKENRILKYDGRSFYSDELKMEVLKRLK